MTNETNSIFDKDFVAGTAIRRRDLMPLALKIYVWFFVIAAALTIVRSAYSYSTVDTFRSFTTLSSLDILNFIMMLATPFLRFLPNLFLLLERRWAVLLTLVTVGISILLQCYNTFKMYYLAPGAMFLVINLFILLIEVPYVIMLWKIKDKWENVAVAKVP
ncbi:hypothetical protein [Chitinophaga arvensicola]|uniref:Uncharacterized protein n=1 Tax=Chitinophaga arvensicola TaxID=29529 RepID=A0A1I0S9Z6_9BACT|nr:hypothetical protein [Chitinophaga arvensicola]SEW53057.1 hypothetical protein SAMN04488122_5319 [Chitinophaga arvensicola]